LLQPAVEVLPGDLAQHGVDELGPPVAEHHPGQLDGRGHGGVRRDPGAEQLVRAQAQHVEHRRVHLPQRPVDAGRDHGVVGALVAQRAVHQLGGERRVPRVQLPLLARLAQQRRQDEVGIGVPLVHGPQGLEGEDADGVLLGPTVRLAGPAGPTGLVAHGKKVLRVWGEVRAPAYVVVAGRRGPRGQAPTVSPAPMRTPRAQSAALIGFLPWACTHSSSTAWEPVPAYTLFLAADSSPGARSVRPGAGATWTSLSRSPRKVVQAPGAGVQPRTTRSTRSAGARQSTRASSTVTLG